ncbi:MAG TPA: hypothetical protein VHW24_06945 [Bryobacteraceae bacterium]|nr:hypothetical protein [Bryobacteraceae bacterium]
MKKLIVISALTALTALAQTTVTGSKTMQGSWDASGAAATKPAKSGSSLPATCSTGEFFFNTSSAAGQNLYLCAAANTWTQVSSGVTSIYGRNGVVTAQSGDYNFSQLSGAASAAQLPAAGGDIGGTLTSATVKSIQGKSVSTTAPSSGQVLTWNGTQWLPQSISTSLSGDVTGATSTTKVQAIQGQAVANTAPTTGQVLTWNGTQWIPQSISTSLGGDVTGAIPTTKVQAIQGQAVANTAPATGQVLTWSGFSWGPQNPTGASGGTSTVAERVLVFDGSTTVPGETMTAWTCTSGSGAACTTSWTVPSAVIFVRVQIWSAGGSGTATGAGGAYGGGGGGGYWEATCPVSPSSNVAITVGLGGQGLAAPPWSQSGGNSSFATCATVLGGTPSWAGYLAGTSPWGWMDANGSLPQYTALHDATKSYCTAGGAPGSVTARSDGGGCGGGGGGNGLAGPVGGASMRGGGGGGGGAFNNATGGTGGVAALGNTLYTNGGNGGNGGGWTSAGGYVACTNGTAPGGGGGSPGSATSGATIVAGCSGARGEVRVYYVH